jgi:APA family basic amino acid/polyamine antiporter
VSQIASPDSNPSARKLGLIAATALVMGNMIGSGEFLLPACLAPFGWNAVGGWIITISGALVLAWVLARLTRALPEAVGAVGFVEKAFGAVPGFLISWVYLVSIWTAVVTIAVAAISYLSSMIPELGAHEFLPALAAVGLLWLLTLLNLRGIKEAGRFQVVTVALKVVPLIVVLALAAGALASGTGEVRPFEPQAISLTALNGAAALTLWALLGFECASIAAAQVRDPSVNVPRATMWGTGLTGVLYLTVCSAIALMLPEAIAASSPAPFASFVERYWSAGPAALIAAVAVLSCVGALNGWVLMQGEMTRSMAARGMLPAWLAGTDAKGTPIRGLLVSSVIASLFALANASRSLKGLFEFLLLLSTSASLWLYLACALTAVRLNVARGWAVVGAVYSVWMLWGAGVGASGLSLVLMAAGLPIYWWSRRHSAKQAVQP